MQVVGYLHNADVLIEDEQHVAVIGECHYVLSLGDRVYLQQNLDVQSHRYAVEISFLSAGHVQRHPDQIQVRFLGCRELLQQYLNSTTVH